MPPPACASLTPDQVRALPALARTRDSHRAIGVGYSNGRRMIAEGRYPVPVLDLGAQTRRVRRADLIAFLGLDTADAAPATHAPAVTSGDGAAIGTVIRWKGGKNAPVGRRIP